MRTIRHLLAAFALLAVCFAAVPARASLGTNFSDQWWVPAESGWGVSVHQQHDTLFVIFFVYGPDAKPVWYSGAAVYQYNSGNPLFAGDLYQTSGPWFGGDFNAVPVSYRKVGTIQFNATSVDTATLTYSVDGTTVMKSIERQAPWRYEDFTGEYYGGLDYSASGCSDPTSNGYFEQFGPIHVDHSLVNSMTLVAQSSAGSCTFSGTYTQAGHMGSVTGSFDCGGGVAGPMQVFEMERTGSGMTARFAAQTGSCTVAGRLGGIERESPRN